MVLPLFPLLLFVTTLGSVALYLRTANDIFGVLAVALSFACLVWGLVVAHWSIHLLALVALLLLRKPKVIARLAASLK